jgi:hypothetical protein
VCGVCGGRGVCRVCGVCEGRGGVAVVGVWGHSLRSTFHRLHLLRLWTPTIFITGCLNNGFDCPSGSSKLPLYSKFLSFAS